MINRRQRVIASFVKSSCFCSWIVDGMTIFISRIVLENADTTSNPCFFSSLYAKDCYDAFNLREGIEMFVNYPVGKHFDILK